ncbi:hypothetical protein UlMin_031451 [Ulmus minor]
MGNPFSSANPFPHPLPPHRIFSALNPPTLLFSCVSNGSHNRILFLSILHTLNESLKLFTSALLNLMRSAHWDIAAAVRSIEAASTTADNSTIITISSITAHHAKFALESYVSRKIFEGFNHKTFYMDGSLSSLLNPDQFRRDCFTQYRDMKSMDPIKLLGILPTCHFGKFCSKKYLAIVHPKMEESLFRDLEQYL